VSRLETRGEGALKYILILALIGLITVLFLSGFAFRVIRTQLSKKRKGWR
jgi:cytochrome bd-type quinol oxidase subunit 2